MIEFDEAIIGDVHGCYEELGCLLDQLRDRPVVFVGDLIDKGPEPAKCVRMARERGAGLVLGNHEETFLRWLNHDDATRSTMRGHSEYETLVEGLDAPDIEWLQRAGFYTVAAGGLVTVVHGGIPGRVTNLGWADANDLCRTRYTEKGHRVHLSDLQAGHSFPHWTEEYRGQFGPVVYGHEPYRSVRVDGHAIGIDTGCVHGGSLTALLGFDPVSGEYISKSVDAVKEYAPWRLGRHETL